MRLLQLDAGTHVQSVTVDRKACELLARLIAPQQIPQDREELPSLQLPASLVGNFFLLLISICHQTSPPGRLPLVGRVHGKVRRGWDYLFQRLLDSARKDHDLLAPSYWTRVSSEEIRRLFADAEFGARLTDPEGRCRLIRDLGENMLSSGWSLADDLYRHCQGRVATGQPNLLEVLARFKAYSDPVKKKSLYFLSVMRNQGRWRYSDDASLGPPVDYHEVRGHLRLGTVRINDQDLLKKLKSQLPVTASEDVALRQAVYDAIMLISQRSGVCNPSQMHYLFWNVFRSVCLRENPQCFELSSDCELPERYRHLASVGEKAGCPFAAVCRSAGNLEPLSEHVFKTDYY